MYCIYTHCINKQYWCKGYDMRVELMINKTFLGKDDFPRIENEFTRRIALRWPDARLRVRKGTNNDLTVLGGIKDVKKDVSKVLEEMFDEADEWLYIEK